MTRQTIEDAVTRFNSALENLSLALERRRLNEDSLSQMEEDLHQMGLDRAQLARQLDEALARGKTAENAAAAVGARLDRVLADINGLIAEAEAA